ncbi:MAG: hypothetical protein H7X89_02630 [Rhizobiales bacterium]|nr:hypothetical protein [Hyphomicrobiales bacterium]
MNSITTKANDAQRGWLKSIVSQKGSDLLLQNLTYTFNQAGNLTKRGDGELGANPLTETITLSDDQKIFIPTPLDSFLP